MGLASRYPSRTVADLISLNQVYPRPCKPDRRQWFAGSDGDLCIGASAVEAVARHSRLERPGFAAPPNRITQTVRNLAKADALPQGKMAKNAERNIPVGKSPTPMGGLRRPWSPDDFPLHAGPRAGHRPSLLVSGFALRRSLTGRPTVAQAAHHRLHIERDYENAQRNHPEAQDREKSEDSARNEKKSDDASQSGRHVATNPHQPSFEASVQSHDPAIWSSAAEV